MKESYKKYYMSVQNKKEEKYSNILEKQCKKKIFKMVMNKKIEERKLHLEKIVSGIKVGSQNLSKKELQQYKYTKFYNKLHSYNSIYNYSYKDGNKQINFIDEKYDLDEINKID